MSTMASKVTSNVQVRSRRVTPRVRSGCLTCKARRVKCDEAKPSCRRCTSASRICEGYAQSTNNTHFSVMVINSMHSPPRALSTLKSSGDNIRHLEFYHHCASRRIATDFDQPFWSRTTLQMAQSEPCIRNALIAIGYLSKATTGSLKNSILYSNGRDHGRTLFHYNSAVKLLLKRMREPSYRAEIGLVACLLFICIEFLRGENRMALVHFTSGLNIIAGSQNRSSDSSGITGQSGIIKDSLEPIFIRMMATPLMYGIPSQIVTNDPPELCTRPFTSVLQAQKTLHKIRNTAMLFLHDMLPKLSDTKLISHKDRHKQAEILHFHSTWLQSLERFQEQANLSKIEMAAIHSLKASHYSTYIFVACATLGTQMAFDAHLEDFKALLNHADLFLDIQKSTQATINAGPNFTFDTMIISYVVFAATYCRCPITRRRAISLLEQKPPREGLCDAEQNIVVMKRLIDIEESETDIITGWPLEKARIWFVNIKDDIDETGKFSANFAVGIWGDGQGIPTVDPGLVLRKGETDRLWREWFIV